MKFFLGWHYLYFFFFPEESCNPFFLLFYGTDMCCTPCHFRQLVYQHAVRFSSPFKHFHYVQQVCLLFGKQSTKSVYLFRAYIFTAVSFKRVQQTVGLKSVVTIVQIVRFVPIYHTLTQCGEPRNTAMSRVDTTTYKVYVCRLCLNFAHPLPFIYQNGGHATDDRHKYGIAEKYFISQRHCLLMKNIIG